MGDVEPRYSAGQVFENQVSGCRNECDADGPTPVLLQDRNIKVQGGELQPLRVLLPVASENVLKREHALDCVIVSDLTAFRRPGCARGVQTVTHIVEL